LEAVNIYLAPKNNKRVKIDDPALSKKVEIMKTYAPVKEDYYGDPMVFSTHLFLKGRSHDQQHMDFPEIKKAFVLELEKTSPLDYADLLKGLRKSSEEGPLSH
jgi:hypothetical protein